MLTRWYEDDGGLALVDELRRRMDRLFQEFDLGAPTHLSGTWPRGNLYDAGESLIAVLEVPGVSEKDLRIDAHQDVLTVSGERRVQPPEGYTVHRNERPPIRFSRSFGLPSRVDLEKTTAVVKDGLLTVTMPKHAEARPRQITVAAG